MALITCQGFDCDTWSTIQFPGWLEIGSLQHASTTGRRGTDGLFVPTIADALAYDLPAPLGTVIVGYAAYFNEPSPGADRDILELRDESTGNEQLALTYHADGAISINRAGVILAKSPAGIITPQQWHFIEVKATIHNTTGSFTVRVDEVTRLTIINTDTQISTNASVDQIRWTWMGAASGDVIDDIYILDTTDTINNNLLGDMQVDTLHVAADGTQSDWTPLAGSNFENVDEAIQDGDVTYNSSNTAGHIDLYDMESLAYLGGGTVNAVVVHNCVRHDSASQTVRPLLRVNGTTYEGADHTVESTYTYTEEIYQRNPDTLTAWTRDAVNLVEAGVKLQAI